MKLIQHIALIILLQFSCGTTSVKKQTTTGKNEHSITCTEKGCKGTYEGQEFIGGDDVAHQFSNKMSGAVGDKLKELYQSKKYKKVDFSGIEMTTQGMGSGNVTYYLNIPFISVPSKYDAYTSFDHVGGWNHKPALERRKKELENVTMPGHELDISNLKTTPQGLQEYWIQWKNKTVQAECE